MNTTTIVINHSDFVINGMITRINYGMEINDAAYEIADMMHTDPALVLAVWIQYLNS